MTPRSRFRRWAVLTGALVLALPSAAASQTDARVTTEENFRRVPNGEVLARLVESSDDGITARDSAGVTADEMKEMGLSAREIRELVEKVQAPDHPDFELDLSTMRSADEIAETMYEAVPGNFE